MDLLRIAACLGVVAFHLTFLGYADRGMMPQSFPELSPVTKYGFLGVELFFMISGFVVAHTASERKAADFFVARASRLLPAFWVCCLFSFFLVRALHPERMQLTSSELLLNLTMLGGFFKVTPVDNSYWSLTVELHFYFLLLVVVALGAMRHLRWLIVGWMLLSLALLARPFPLLGFFMIPYWSAFFAAGVAFWLRSRGDNSPAVWLTLAISWPLSIWLTWGRLPELSVRLKTNLEPAVVAAVISAFFVLLLLASRRGTPASRPSAQRWVVAAALTYPLYLIHQHAGHALMNAANPYIGRFPALFLTCAALIAVAYAVHRIVELPVSRAARHLFPRHAKELGNAGASR